MRKGMVIVQVAVGDEYRARFAHGLGMMRCYADKHNYTLVQRADLPKGMKLGWLKVHTALEHIGHAEWVFILDSDVHPVDMDCRLERYIESTAHVIVGGVREHTLENMAGAVFIRGSFEGRAFLERWLNVMRTTGLGENRAYVKVLQEYVTQDDPLVALCHHNKYCGVFPGCTERVRVYPPLHFALRTQAADMTLPNAQYPLFGNECLIHGKDPRLFVDKRFNCKDFTSGYFGAEFVPSTNETLRASITSYLRAVSAPFDKQRDAAVEARCFPSCHLTRGCV